MEADMEPQLFEGGGIGNFNSWRLSIRRNYGGAFHTCHTYVNREGDYTAEKSKLRYATVPMPTGREIVLEKI